MKKKKLGKVRLGSRTRRRTLLLSRKARIRKGPSRKAGRGLALRTGKTKRGLLPRRKEDFAAGLSAECRSSNRRCR
ncbi:hypothetical protein JI735_02940 [Paenibacillus sonchi]|uniref:Uncharacterized protein n=1 Tax=Paenibacillus sonchi TaxID=373687 RepID=A0A974SCR7_9BACL|nr:hypothetical protein [Paenibacillus sonchi]QQZ61723.1 hypothetical protein JI735_02940 [Paenibacillus sonchi]